MVVYQNKGNSFQKMYKVYHKGLKTINNIKRILNYIKITNNIYKMLKMLNKILNRTDYNMLGIMLIY